MCSAVRHRRRPRSGSRKRARPCRTALTPTRRRAPSTTSPTLCRWAPPCRSPGRGVTASKGRRAPTSDPLRVALDVGRQQPGDVLVEEEEEQQEDRRTDRVDEPAVPPVREVPGAEEDEPGEDAPLDGRRLGRLLARQAP